MFFFWEVSICFWMGFWELEVLMLCECWMLCLYVFVFVKCGNNVVVCFNIFNIGSKLGYWIEIIVDFW